jgi:intein/homing endonuclease
MFYAYHREHNLLIPRSDDLKKVGKASTIAMIEGKKFKGALVVKPIPGIHFDVVCVDFSSLYPSAIKTWNLSYETMNCTHEECKENKIPETSHWVCKKKVGIIALLIGLLRDLRVEYFKKKAKEEGLTDDEQYIYKIIVQSMKIIINASYGVLGSEAFPLFCLPVAEATTAIGRYAITMTQEKCKEIGLEVIYGDSITEETPIIIKDGNLIDIINIKDLFDRYEHSNTIIDKKLYSTPDKDVYVWSNGEWVKVRRVMKHKFNKKIYRIKIKDSYVKVTQDHSLFLENGEEVRPSEIEVGNRILRSKLPEIEFNNIQSNWAFALGLFIADGSCNTYYYPKKKHTKYTWAINNKNKKLLEQCQELLPFKTVILDTLKSSNVYKLVPYSEKIKNIKKICRCGRKVLARGLCSRCYQQAEREGTLDDYLGHNNISKKVTKQWREWCYNSLGQKRIPNFVFNFSKESKIKFLEGLFAGDGYSDKKYKYKFQNYNTNSHQLALGIQILIKSITGQDVNYKTRKDKIDNIALQFNSPNPIKKLQKISNQVKEILEIDYDNYVYDIETDNGKFNVGTIVCHNTDSCFILKPTQEQIDLLIQWSSETLGLDLDMEKSFRYLALSDRKKNYFGVYPDGTVDIKGLTGKKKHTPIFLQKIFKEVIAILGSVKKQEEFERARKQIVKKVKKCIKKLENGEIPLEELAFRITLSKNLEKYTKTVPQHVKAGKLLARKKKRDIGAGDIIRFIKTRTMDGVMPLEIASINSVNIKKYKEAMESIFVQILEPIGINISDLYGKRARTMDDFLS